MSAGCTRSAPLYFPIEPPWLSAAACRIELGAQDGGALAGMRKGSAARRSEAPAAPSRYVLLAGAAAEGVRALRIVVPIRRGISCHVIGQRRACPVLRFRQTERRSAVTRRMLLGVVSAPLSIAPTGSPCRDTRRDQRRDNKPAHAAMPPNTMHAAPSVRMPTRRARDTCLAEAAKATISHPPKSISTRPKAVSSSKGMSDAFSPGWR